MVGNFPKLLLNEIQTRCSRNLQNNPHHVHRRCMIQNMGKRVSQRRDSGFGTAIFDSVGGVGGRMGRVRRRLMYKNEYRHNWFRLKEVQFGVTRLTSIALLVEQK